MNVQRDFLEPDPETVEAIRAHLDEMRRERTDRWCEHCLALLRGEGESPK